MHCGYLLVYCAPHLSYNHSRFIHKSSLVAAEAPSSEAGRILARNGCYVYEFCLQVYIFMPLGFFNMS
jgi:hypothetical protein